MSSLQWHKVYNKFDHNPPNHALWCVRCSCTIQNGKCNKVWSVTKIANTAWTQQNNVHEWDKEIRRKSEVQKRTYRRRQDSNTVKRILHDEINEKPDNSSYGAAKYWEFRILFEALTPFSFLRVWGTSSQILTYTEAWNFQHLFPLMDQTVWHGLLNILRGKGILWHKIKVTNW